MSNYGFVGGEDPLGELYDEVAGEDPLVGALQLYQQGKALVPANLISQRVMNKSLLRQAGLQRINQIAPAVLARYAASHTAPTTAAAAQVARAMDQAPDLGALAQYAEVFKRAQAGKQPATFIPCTSLAVGAGLAAVIAITPTNRVRIVDYTVSPTSAPNFVITGITLGRVSLFQNAGRLPADMFLPGSNKPPFECPVIYPGQQLVVNILSIAGAAANFDSAFYGIDLDLQV